MERRLELSAGQTACEIRKALLAEALAVAEEDRRIGEAIGNHGATLIPDPAAVLTHCNAGGLATSGFGTALGVVYAAHRMGKKIRVFAGETRPLWQGARLTAWELTRAGVDVTVIPDSAAAWLMKSRRIDCVLVGADRFPKNGDTANKIGTYGLALLARSHGVPFYVAAPATTFDPDADSGADIPIEERSGDELRTAFGRRIVPDAAAVWNPAFDVTPGEIVTGFITERGVLHPPFREASETDRFRAHSYRRKEADHENPSAEDRAEH
jgi:methylthioribose-1-phosphate isomerase